MYLETIHVVLEVLLIQGGAACLGLAFVYSSSLQIWSLVHNVDPTSDGACTSRGRVRSIDVQEMIGTSSALVTLERRK